VGLSVTCSVQKIHREGWHGRQPQAAPGTRFDKRPLRNPVVSAPLKRRSIGRIRCHLGVVRAPARWRRLSTVLGCTPSRSAKSIGGKDIVGMCKQCRPLRGACAVIQPGCCMQTTNASNRRRFNGQGDARLEPAMRSGPAGNHTPDRHRAEGATWRRISLWAQSRSCSGEGMEM
jgi:hypothetical protein